MYHLYKKLIAASVALGMLAFFGTPIAFAETNTQTSTTTDQIEVLLKQIKELQDQVMLLQQKQAALIGNIRETMALARDLREGMSSEDVKALQELLAADPDVYPERIISGFFGPLTAQAVKKFQMKHGIEVVGAVGPKTRAALNSLVGDREFSCKAWGHLIAPGQMKRIGNATIDVSKCLKVPPGIMKKLEGRATTTAATTTDTTALRLSDIMHEDITDTTATIKWHTNEKASAAVWYSTDNDVVDGDDLEMESRSSLATSHLIGLEDLDPDTQYYYLVVSTDAAGNTATSSISDFTTEEE